jgi:hypothetical protein
VLLAGYVSFFYVIISLPLAFQAQREGWGESFRRGVLLVIVGLAPTNLGMMLSWARPKFHNQRFFLITLTLVGIVALNYVSLWGVSLKPPSR